MAKQKSKFSDLPLSTSVPTGWSLDDTTLLKTLIFNRGSAFSIEERKALGFSGLLPGRVGTLQDFTLTDSIGSIVHQWEKIPL